jgi:hypothetical protein
VIQALSFTVKDVCLALGGVSRSRIHMWTRLRPFSLTQTSERSARRFSITDLLTLSALQKLEDIYGIKSSHTCIFSEGIHSYLARPKAVEGSEYVFVRLQDGVVLKFDSLSIYEPGLILDIAEERERINVYLGITPAQRELALVASVQG